MLPCISELDINVLNGFNGLKPEIDHTCTLELTVPTGLEEVAAQECREKLNVKPFTFRGRVVIDVPVNNVSEVLKLRSVEHIYVLVLVEPKFQFSNEREKCLEKLFKFVNSPDWRKGIKVWQSVFHLETEDPFKGEGDLKTGYCAPKPEIDLKFMKSDCRILENLPKEVLSSILNKKEEKECSGKNLTSEAEAKSGADELDKEPKYKDAQRAENGPKFRVTCHRVGSLHKFGSSEAARQFGGGINEKFGWPVDLTHFQLEVLLNIIEEFVYVTFSLTREPLFRRNISFFGPTNLKSTICYNMIQLAKPELGDFIVDPMCGGCSIPIEGALTHTKCFHLGGDNFEAAVTRSRMNIDALEGKMGKSLAIDTLRWDVTSLPLRDQVVDVVVCDLPFGKRMGSRTDNRVLYYKSLVEFARVTKVETGRAVLLTHDRKSITKSLFRVASLWKNFSTRTINVGGLAAGIYLLQRTGIFSNPSIKDGGNKDEVRGEKRKLSLEKE